MTAPPIMNRWPARTFKLSFLQKNRLYLPAHLSAYLQDVLRMKPRGADLRASLQAAMDWLISAHDNGRGGVSGYYSFATGWNAPYPETTGYIIPTMFDYGEFSGQSVYRDRAIAMADWELGIQLANGAFPGGYADTASGPIVFNTGQVLQGLVRAYTETNDERYCTAARQAGIWLLSVQDPDGAWRKHTYRNTHHTYHTRVAWPLLQLHQVTQVQKFADAAERNLQWALKNQQPNGWFKDNVLYLRTDNALTHSIAYAIRGFLESGLLLSNREYLSAAVTASAALKDVFESTGWLPASFDFDWNSNDSYSCVTGNAQISGIWLRLYAVTGDLRYKNAALTMNSSLRASQNTRTANPAIRGGMKGSEPIYGSYMPFCYLNWATKFFIDALILEERSRTIDLTGVLEQPGQPATTFDSMAKT